MKGGMTWLFFSTSGRIGRQLFVLGWLLLTAVSGFFLAILFAAPEGSAALTVWSAFATVAGLLSLWASVMLTVKRLHDIDMAGALAVLIFVPALSMLVVAALAIWPGSPGPNSHGEASNRPSR